jgi:hypothetical protein
MTDQIAGIYLNILESIYGPRVYYISNGQLVFDYNRSIGIVSSMNGGLFHRYFIGDNNGTSNSAAR